MKEKLLPTRRPVTTPRVEWRSGRHVGCASDQWTAGRGDTAAIAADSRSIHWGMRLRTVAGSRSSDAISR